LKNNNLNRKLAFSKAIDFLKNNGINGWYIEFGVGIGTTFKIFFEASRVKKYNHLGAIGYDSFEGFPETEGLERNHPLNRIKFGSRSYSLESVVKYRLKKIEKTKYSLYPVNIETDDIKIKSHIPENQKISLLHFDLDYSTPTLKALNQFHNKWQINYFFFSGYDKLGERLALNTFTDLHPEIKISTFFQYGWHGQAFIVSDILKAL
jgi:hypothetical protein